MEVLQRTANRGSIATGGYNIDNSCKFEADNSEYLKANNTFASTTPTSRQKGTVSFWIKRTEIGNGVSGKQMYIFASSDSSRYSNLGFDEFDNLTVFSGDSSWNGVSPYTYNKFRDTSAWYHIVIRYDTTDSTASNRLRVYSNGTEVSWVTAPNITQDGVMTYSGMNGPCWHSWGTIYSYFTPAKFFSGYLAEAHFVDGQSLAPTEFGETDSDSGIWKPKEYDGTYGNCGYYLDFADSGNLGDDESGNGFDFDENNITAADQATDTPTNNFATLNVLNAISNGGGNNEYSEGATKGKALETSEMASGTMAVTQGKWYYECKAVSNSEIMAGWGVPNKWGHHSVNPGYDEHSFAVHNVGRAYYYGNSYVDFSPSVSFDTNDIISVALDADNGFCYWAKNGTWMNGGSPTSGSTGTGGFNYIGGSTGANMKIVDGDFLVPAVRTNYYTNSAILLNFGGYTTISISSAATDANGYGTFEYAPPSGYYALCTKNLAEYG